MAEQGSGEGFLPPQPGGREPDLGGREGSREPDDTSTAQAQQGFAPPAGSDTSSAEQGRGQHQPPQGQQPPQQWGGQPPPQWQGQPGQQAGWGQAPPGWQQPNWQHQQTAPQPWVYQPRPPAEPDNGPAVAGFTLAMVSSGLLLLSVGLSSIISAICSGLAIVYSRRGRSRVDAGETPKHRGLAQAGFVTGIVSLALSVLATAFWGLLLVLAITDEGFRRELELELEQSSLGDGARGALVAALAAGGLLARLVA